MKNLVRRLTVAKAGLFVLTLLFLVAPISAQNEPPDSPPAQTQGQVAPESDAQSTTEENITTPNLTKVPQAPITVGEYLTGKAKPEPVTPPSEKLNFPEKKDLGEHWATGEGVGRSTFFDKLIQVTWSLAIISLLVWGSAKLASKFGLKHLGVGPSGSKSMIEILERKRLSPGRSIMLIKVGPKVLAVAATESGYETLTEFDGEGFKQYQDSHGLSESAEAKDSSTEAVTTPSDIARHYLSIIPGTGAKK